MKLDISKNNLGPNFVRHSRKHIFLTLEKELDKSNQQILVKNEQLIGIREAASQIFGQFSELRAEITSARRAQIDMRRSMQNEVQSVQTNIITMLEDYEVSRAPKVADFGSDTLTRLQQVL